MEGRREVRGNSDCDAVGGRRLGYPLGRQNVTSDFSPEIAQQALSQLLTRTALGLMVNVRLCINSDGLLTRIAMSDKEWIRSERESRGLSQANLARLLKVSQAKLSAWETGKASPGTLQQESIRMALDDFDRDYSAGILSESIRPRSKKRIIAIKNGDRYEPNSNSGNGNSKSDETLEQRQKRFAEFASTYERQEQKPVAVALFSGLGAMSLGFKNAGFDVPGYIELELAARRIYERNFSAAGCLANDVTQVTDGEIVRWREVFGKVDVVFGGPPCQGFSLTGKRDRFDPRNPLYSHFARIASRLGARAIVLENVRLLTSMTSPDGSLVLDRILEAFTAVGYNCQWMVVNAQDHGVPQSRERFLLVGVRGTKRFSFPEATYGKDTNETLFGPALAPYVTFRDACGDLEELESGESSKADPWHFAVKHPQHVIEWLRDVPEGESAHNNPDPEKRPPSGYNTTYKRIRWDEPCSTISTTFGMISGCRNVHPTNTRSLTIREAARCQTLPDDFELCGNLGQIRTAIGNAVPPRLAEVIARHLLDSVLKATSTTSHQLAAYGSIPLAS